MKKTSCATCTMIGVVCLIGAGCTKKVAVTPPSSPQVHQAAAVTPDKPVIELFTASPGSIDKGSDSTLRWAVLHANNVQIAPALGQVSESGSRLVFPSASTVYTMTATGPGGTATATTSVNLILHRASNMPDQATRARIQDLLNRIQDAYFDYNKDNLRPDARTALVSDAHTLSEILKQYPGYKLTVEGFCDERGSEEYNLALGEKRADEAKQYLTSLGVPAAQLKTISFGKERQVCSEHDEACWQRNRRAHITQEQ